MASAAPAAHDAVAGAVVTRAGAPAAGFAINAYKEATLQRYEAVWGL